MSTTTINTTGMPRPPARARVSVRREAAAEGSEHVELLVFWSWWVIATAVSTVVSGLAALLRDA